MGTTQRYVVLTAQPYHSLTHLGNTPHFGIIFIQAPYKGVVGLQGIKHFGGALLNVGIWRHYDH